MIPLAKLPARPHEPHFDRTFGRSEEMGNVADAAVVEVAQVDHRLVFQAQQIECFSQHKQVHIFFENSLQDEFFLHHAVGRVLAMHEDDLAFAPAREVHAVIMGNGIKPGGEFGAGLE